MATPKCHDLNRVCMWIKNICFVSLPLCVSLRFKATLWLSEVHPLSLAEQVTPIIDLMAISNAHFAKLRDFITLSLPPGFPVKIGEKKCHMELIDHFRSLKSTCNQNLLLFTFLKGQSTKYWVIICLPSSLTHFFILWNTKDDILKNVGKQTVLGPKLFLLLCRPWKVKYTHLYVSKCTSLQVSS